jgi:hypothetical protein
MAYGINESDCCRALDSQYSGSGYLFDFTPENFEIFWKIWLIGTFGDQLSFPGVRFPGPGSFAGLKQGRCSQDIQIIDAVAKNSQ